MEQAREAPQDGKQPGPGPCPRPDGSGEGSRSALEKLIQEERRRVAQMPREGDAPADSGRGGEGAGN